MNSNYYIPKENSFRSIIHSIWQVDHVVSYSKEYIIPKGIIEIIFNFSEGSPILANLNNSQYHLSDCFINGFNTAPIRLQLPKRQDFFGVVFQPLAIKKIFRNPASEFTDITVDLGLIDSSYVSLWHQLAEQKSFDERVSVFLAWAAGNFIEWNDQENEMNRFLYSANQHELSVKELASSLCYSTRHLSRKIFEATGMNSEEILLYKKYLHAVHLIHHTNSPLTEIAYQSQFADQSHFIKSFKSFTNMTPGDYRQNKSMVKGHIFEDVR